MVFGKFFGKYLSSIYTALALPATIVSENFLVFYFSFSQFPTILSSSFLLKLLISLVIPEVLLHFRCRDLWVVSLPSSKYLHTCWNGLLQQSLITDDLGQRWKVHHSVLIFPISLSPFILYVETVHKMNQILFFSPQISLNYFSATELSVYHTI